MPVSIYVWALPPRIICVVVGTVATDIPLPPITAPCAASEFQILHVGLP
jgi:hypothetical protein